MKLLRTLLLVGAGWIALISLLHGTLNLGWTKSRPSSDRWNYLLGFLPVTCHLTCPVTDYINRNSAGGEGLFEPIRFNGFPELKEAFLSGHTQATFILAPLAMVLREQGVPLKIVYLGHRDGTAMMVHRESSIHRIEDLRGKRIAVPNRYSNQLLILYRAFEQRGMTIDDVTIVEMAPPDMPAALYAKAVDAITSGEPFMGQTELDGYGRVLYLTKDVWPGFISCVLAVHEDMIRDHRDAVQNLVDGIARSGKWLDQTIDNRHAAAEFVSKIYYNQHPRLLQFVLSKPPDRVKYTNLTVQQPEFEEIERLAIKSGILDGRVGFADYTDVSFVRDEAALEPYTWPAATVAPSASGASR
ncbi:MAG TPA: ABC transporter substrate-binding protein [Candidatus Synoicihabitans sp.]|nr:ABC transporter substrate-binding protein [Candidatus Synoicihabitans sp.]